MRILKIISLASAFAFSNVFAITQTALVPSSFNIEYQLEPQDPKLLDNFMFSTIKANCTIIDKKNKINDNDDDNDDNDNSTESTLDVKMIRKSGSLNGVCLSQGDKMQIVVTNGDKFQFSVESGARVQLINKGTHTIKANCSIG